MSPGLIVSFKPVAPLLVLPGIAHNGPGRRGNSTNNAIMTGNACSSRRPLNAPVDAIRQELAAAPDLNQRHRREPDEQHDVGDRQRATFSRAGSRTSGSTRS